MKKKKEKKRKEKRNAKKTPTRTEGETLFSLCALRAFYNTRPIPRASLFTHSRHSRSFLASAARVLSRSPLRPLRLRFFVPKGATHPPVRPIRTRSDRARSKKKKKKKKNIPQDKMTSNQRTRQTSLPTSNREESFLSGTIIEIFVRLSIRRIARTRVDHDSYFPFLSSRHGGRIISSRANDRSIG